jgi:mRNA interferase HigB
MHIITYKRINEFINKYPETKNSLVRWYKKMKKLNIKTFIDLRKMYPQADQVERLTVFNIGGNKIRLVTSIHYNRQKVYIRDILTHEEYNKNKWIK